MTTILKNTEMGTDKIHVLLAGNGSRSRYISELFKDKNKALNALLGEVFSGTLPQLTLHQPLSASVDDLSLPTSKTGVALGLLELTPGSGVLMLNSQLAAQDGQAPFLWNVGKSRRRKFEVVLDTSAGYGQWQELGILQQGAFKLYATKSPRAQSGMEVGDVELSYHELHFPAATPAARLFARAVNPNTIQLGYAETLETLEETAVSELVLD